MFKNYPEILKEIQTQVHYRFMKPRIISLGFYEYNLNANRSSINLNIESMHSKIVEPAILKETPNSEASLRKCYALARSQQI